jgi:recombination protein RecA
MENIDRLVQDLNKSYVGTGLTQMIRKGSEMPHLRTFPTGIPTLDYDLGGGLLWGRTIIVAGNAGTGKTSLAYQTLAQAQKSGITGFWFDLEKAFDRDRAEKFGVDMDSLYVINNDELTAENVFALLRDTIRAVKAQEDTRAIFIVDSIAGIQIENMYETDAGHVMAGNAKAVNQSVTIWNILLAENQILFLINELRDTMAAMGEPDVMPGGRAQEYFSSQTLWTRAGQTIKDGTTPIGQEMKWTIKKSRSSPPKEVGLINYHYKTGFELGENLVSVALEMALLEQAGAWFTAPNGERFHGKDKLVAKLMEDVVFMDELKLKIYAAMPISNWDGKKIVTE